MEELALRAGPEGATVFYGEEPWVSGLGIRLRGQALDLVGDTESRGEDRLGRYTGRALTYARKGEELFRLRLKLYPERRAVLVEAEALVDLAGLAGEDSFLTSPVDAPAFRVRDAGFLLFTWGMVGPGGEGEWPHPIYGKRTRTIPMDRPFAPLVITDGRRSLVISPASHFPVSPLRALGEGAFARGLHGAIDHIPAGTRLRTAFVFGEDPFATLLSWGDLLLELGGRGRPGACEHPVLAHLGYWTDYGAYYSDLFHPANEDVLLALARYFRAQNIPVGYFGLDLWYEYERAGLARAYRPDRGKFPRGLGPIARETGIPMFLHLSGFARDNAYQGRYRFLEGEEAACPAEPRFYQDLAAELLGEGAIGVWHDHLRNQQGRIPALRASLDLAEEWFRGMTQAFSAAGLPLMLSVPTMGFLLAASKCPGVIAARSGEDYLVRHEGQLSMLPREVRGKYELVPYREFIKSRFLVGWLLYCLGMYPFHDVFITDAAHPEGFSEPRAWDEALMRALSCGPVGIGDKLGRVDREIVRRLCFPDGELAKPDRPALPLWDPLEEGLLVGVAETNLPAGTWRFIAVYNLGDEPRGYRLDLGELGAEGAVAYDYTRGRAVPELAAELPPEGGAYFVLAPLIRGVALLGFLDKFITLPTGRCRLEPTGRGLAAAFSTPPGVEYLVGAHSPGRLTVEAEGAELVEVLGDGGLYRIRVRPKKRDWSLILKGG